MLGGIGGHFRGTRACREMCRVGVRPIRGRHTVQMPTFGPEFVVFSWGFGLGVWGLGLRVSGLGFGALAHVSHI